MAEIDDRWLSVDEICKYLGIGSQKDLKVMCMEAIRHEL